MVMDVAKFQWKYLAWLTILWCSKKKGLMSKPSKISACGMWNLLITFEELTVNWKPKWLFETFFFYGSVAQGFPEVNLRQRWWIYSIDLKRGSQPKVPWQEYVRCSPACLNTAFWLRPWQLKRKSVGGFHLFPIQCRNCHSKCQLVSHWQQISYTKLLLEPVVAPNLGRLLPTLYTVL